MKYKSYIEIDPFQFDLIIEKDEVYIYYKLLTIFYSRFRI